MNQMQRERLSLCYKFKVFSNLFPDSSLLFFPEYRYKSMCLQTYDTIFHQNMVPPSKHVFTSNPAIPANNFFTFCKWGIFHFFLTHSPSYKIKVLLISLPYLLLALHLYSPSFPTWIPSIVHFFWFHVSPDFTCIHKTVEGGVPDALQ